MNTEFNGLSTWTVQAHIKNLIEMEEQRIREDNAAHPKGRKLELDESQAYLTAMKFVGSAQLLLLPYLGEPPAVSHADIGQAVWELVKEKRLKQYDLKHGRETDLSRHRVFYRQKETNSARYLDECESTGFTMTVEMDRRAECECCGTDLKLLGNFDYRGEIMTAGIVYKAYREDEYYYSPPEWQGIDWRTTDYRVKNPDVLLEGAINDLMKQLMTYLYKNDTREEV
jgi:hypothetical protein